MTPDDALTVLNVLDHAPSDVPGVLRQGEILIRYAVPGTPACDAIRHDAELLLSLTPHGLPGPELLELDLGARRMRHAFSLQRLPHPDAVPAREGEEERVWQQVGAHLRRLHDLPTLAPGLVIPAPDPLRLLEELNHARAITDSDLKWLEVWITQLQEQAGTARVATLHGRLRPADILLSPDRQTVLGLLDWSAAHQGDPAREFVYLPLRAYGAIADGYGDHTPAMLLAYLTRLLLDIREAAQGRLAMGAVTSRLFALFQFNLERSTGSRQ